MSIPFDICHIILATHLYKFKSSLVKNKAYLSLTIKSLNDTKMARAAVHTPHPSLLCHSWCAYSVSSYFSLLICLFSPLQKSPCITSPIDKRGLREFMYFGLRLPTAMANKAMANKPTTWYGSFKKSARSLALLLGPPAYHTPSTNNSA